MAKYLMLGKYSVEAVKGISPERTKKAVALFKKQGGKIIGMYALIGPYDLALIVDMPSNAALVRTAIALTKLTGIGFFSSPAMTVEEFDRIVR
ncbi:MAG: GYD domain-containing protein [Candidatus Omnitrophica bacterium]|nr:GYD domain-containing protein [Candidatus Omnitrophota bacterium]